MKKIVVILSIITLFFSGIFFSWTVNSKSEEAEKLLLWEVEFPEPRRSILENIKDFNNQYPGIKVKPVTIDYGVYNINIKVALAGNQMPDVIHCQPGESLDTMIEAGVIADLTEKLKNNQNIKDMFLPGAFENVTYQGKIYGLPASFNNIVFWYNKQIFNKYKLDVPETWSELIEIIDKLNTHQVTPITIAGKDGWSLLHWFAYLVQRTGGRELFDQVDVDKADFTRPDFVEAAEKMKELVNSNSFNENFMELDNKTAESRFISGKAAMYLQGDWFLSSLAQNTDFSEKIGFFQFPIIEGGKGDINVFQGGFNGILAIANRKKIDTAFEFIKYSLNYELFEDYLIEEKQPVPVSIFINKNDINQLTYEYITYINRVARSYFGYYSQQLTYSKAKKLIAILQKIISMKTVNIEQELEKL